MDLPKSLSQVPRTFSLGIFHPSPRPVEHLGSKPKAVDNKLDELGNISKTVRSGKLSTNLLGYNQAFVGNWKMRLSNDLEKVQRVRLCRVIGESKPCDCFNWGYLITTQPAHSTLMRAAVPNGPSGKSLIRGAPVTAVLETPPVSNALKTVQTPIK